MVYIVDPPSAPKGAKVKKFDAKQPLSAKQNEYF